VVEWAQFLLRLPKETKTAIKVAADKAGVSNSEWIRQAIKARFERELDPSEVYNSEPELYDWVEQAESSGPRSKKRDTWWK